MYKADSAYQRVYCTYAINMCSYIIQGNVVTGEYNQTAVVAAAGGAAQLHDHPPLPALANVQLLDLEG